MKRHNERAQKWGKWVNECARGLRWLVAPRHFLLRQHTLLPVRPSFRSVLHSSARHDDKKEFWASPILDFSQLNRENLRELEAWSWMRNRKDSTRILSDDDEDRDVGTIGCTCVYVRFYLAGRSVPCIIIMSTLLIRINGLYSWHILNLSFFTLHLWLWEAYCR